MEGLEKTHVMATNSEKDTGLPQTDEEQQNLSESKNQLDIPTDTIQKVIPRSELNDNHPYNEIAKEDNDIFVSNSNALDDDFLVGCLVRKSSNDADGSEEGKNSKNVAQIETNCKVNFETTQAISCSSSNIIAAADRASNDANSPEAVKNSETQGETNGIIKVNFEPTQAISCSSSNVIVARDHASNNVDSPEEGKNSETHVETNCTVKVNFESTQAMSCSSSNVIAATDPSSNGHQNKAKDAVSTEILSSQECLMNGNADTEALVERAVQPVKMNINNGYRCDSDSWSDDDDDDSSSTSDTSSDSEFFQMMIESSAPKKIPVVKTKGELGLEDLPPIEDLVISVQEEEMMHIGKIHAVVEKIVVIHAVKDMKPLDIDSVLFLSHDKPLGRVFDVFGPVVEPFYCVRFNSTDEIFDKGIEVGSDVFFAPEKGDITTYVFVDDLQRQKGSDASWRHNNEPPEEYLDFSDDEKEKAARRKRMTKNRNHQFSNDSDIASKRPSLAVSGDLSPQSNRRNNAHSALQRNDTHVQPFRFPRRNPFSTPLLPPPSPTPSMCSIMSTPVRVQNSFNRFPTPNQPRLPFSDLRRPFSQNLLQRSPSPLLYTTYQQPYAFGQMALLSPMPSPSPLHSSVMNNIPTLIPASQLSPMTPSSYFNQSLSPINPSGYFNQSLSPINPSGYFNQSFSRNPSPLTHVSGNPHVYLDQRFTSSPSPVPQSRHISPDPWLPNRSPNSFHVPPNHPLTVQIPNQNNPSITVHTFQQDNVPLQPFVNSNIRFHNGNVQSRFY